MAGPSFAVDSHQQHPGSWRIDRLKGEPYSEAPIPSLHPKGIKAAATSETPRSVASKLNCAAAFLVSNISTLMPSSEMHLLVCGLNGRLFLPTPSMRRSEQRPCQHWTLTQVVTCACNSSEIRDRTRKLNCRTRKWPTYRAGAKVHQLIQTPQVGARIGPRGSEAAWIVLLPRAAI